MRTYLERPFTRTIANKLLHPKQQNVAIVCRSLRTIVLHELLHELLQKKTTIAATPLAKSTPSLNSQARACSSWGVGLHIHP